MWTCENLLNVYGCNFVTMGSQGRGFENLHQFQHLVYAEDADVVYVNETWLGNDIMDFELLHSG